MISGLLAAAATAAIAAQPAAAQIPPAQFGPTQQLSTGVVVDGSTLVPSPTPPRVGVDARGRALVAWSVPVARGDGTVEVRVAAAPADAPFGPAQVVDRGTFPRAPAQPVVAVAPGGRALLAWRTGADDVVVAQGDANGAFAAPRLVARGRLPQAVVIAGDGAAFVFTTRGGGTLAHPVAPDGRVGRPQRLAVALEADSEGLASDRALALGADGTIAAVAGRSVTVRRPGENRFRRAVRAFAGEISSSALAVGPGGRVAVAGVRPKVFGEAESYGDVLLAELPSGAMRFGRPRRAPVRRAAFSPAVSYAPAGRPVVAWVRDRDLSDLDGEAETPAGAASAWTPGRTRRLLARDVSYVRLDAVGRSVLAISLGRAFRASLLSGPAATPTRRRAPAGGVLGDPSLAVGATRSVLAWEGEPDGGVRVAFAPSGP